MRSEYIEKMNDVIIWDNGESDDYIESNEEEPAFIRAPTTMSVARRRMRELDRAFRYTEVNDDGAWITGWYGGEGVRRKWVFMNPNHPVTAERRFCSASQVVAMLRQSVSSDNPLVMENIELRRKMDSLHAAARLCQKRIRHLEEVLIVTSHHCQRYQENWKREEQRNTIIKRRFGEDLGCLSNEELLAVQSTCQDRILSAQNELSNRDDAVVGDVLCCNICQTEKELQSRCKSCGNEWCVDCEKHIVRCPYCRDPF